jgi:hypothetical protein
MVESLAQPLCVGTVLISNFRAHKLLYFAPASPVSTEVELSRDCCSLVKQWSIISGLKGEMPLASNDFNIVSFLNKLSHAFQNREKKSPFLIGSNP